MVGAASVIMLRNTMSTKINSTEEMAVATGLRTFGGLPDVPRRTPTVELVCVATGYRDVPRDVGIDAATAE